MKKLLLLFSLVISVTFMFAQDPTATLKLGTLYEPAPGLVNVPITLEAIDNPILGNNLISSWGWYIVYNADVLGDEVNFVNVNPLFPFPNYVTNVVQDVPAPGYNSIALIYSVAVSSPGTVGMSFLDLQFNYSGGTSTLDWAGLGGFFTNMADDEGNEFVLTLVNGCVCLNEYDVTFNVTDDNGLPLQGAQVTVGSETIATDASGIAIFSRPNGNYSYTITNTGYGNKTGNFTVAGAPVTLNVMMFPIGSEFDITFHVTDGTNNIENAMVTVGSETFYTNASGLAVFSLANGNYSYDISKYGFIAATGSFNVLNANQTIEVQLTMLPHYDITFHVTSGGNNIEGVSIFIAEAGTLVTNSNGNAVFSLIDGVYNYTLTKTGFAVKTGTVTVAGANLTVEETMNPLYAVTFHTTDGGTDLAGVSITVGSLTLVTNASGIAIFNLENGNYSYTASKSGYDVETGNFNVAGANIIVEVPMDLIEYLVTFHVTSGGVNVVNALVTVDLLSATTNGNGIATLMLPNGDYVYTVTAAGYYDEQDAFSVSGGPVTVEVVLIPIPTYPVTIHVTSGGVNLSGADVTIGSQTITTNSSGNAIFDLLNGTYNYTVVKFGYVTQSGSFSVVNEPLTVEVVMPLVAWETTFHVTSVGANLSGALVTVNPGNFTGTTGANGNAIINLINGSYTYTVEKAGYVTQTGSLVVNNAIQTIEVNMPPTPWVVTFHVVSVGGPLEGVTIICDGQTEITNANGDAIFNLPNGTYNYTATKAGYLPLSGQITVNNSNQIKNLIMVPDSWATTFVIKDQGNVPLQGAEVTVNGQSQTTPANGTVVFQLANGTYPYTVLKDLYQEFEGTVVVNNAAQTVNVNMTLIGIEDITSSSFTVYPNPSTGTFTLTTTALMGYESNITVSDLAGKLVYSGKLSGTEVNVIDLSAQQKGMYILQIIVEDKVYNKTLVIQ